MQNYYLQGGFADGPKVLAQIGITGSTMRINLPYCCFDGSGVMLAAYALLHDCIDEVLQLTELSLLIKTYKHLFYYTTY